MSKSSKIKNNMKNNNAMLVALLLEAMDTNEIPIRVNIDGLSSHDKAVLLVKCCTAVIATSLCAMASDKEDALGGLDSLFVTIEEHIRETRIYDQPIRN